MSFIVAKVRQLTECLNTVFGSTGIANRLGGQDALDDGSDYSAGNDHISSGGGNDHASGGNATNDSDWRVAA